MIDGVVKLASLQAPQMTHSLSSLVHLVSIIHLKPQGSISPVKLMIITMCRSDSRSYVHAHSSEMGGGAELWWGLLMLICHVFASPMTVVDWCYCIPSTGLHTLASHCGIVAHCNWNRIFSETIFPRLPQPQRRLWSSSQYSTVRASRLNLWGALVCLFLRCRAAARGLFVSTLMRIFV